MTICEQHLLEWRAVKSCRGMKQGAMNMGLRVCSKSSLSLSLLIAVTFRRDGQLSSFDSLVRFCSSDN